MPGPKHAIPRKPGKRPDPNGNPRVPNRKSAARLAARQAAFDEILNKPYLAGQGMFFRRPGSQKR